MFGKRKQAFDILGVDVQALPLQGDGPTVALYAGVLACMGLLISWAAPACNNPIFAEIVPEHLRSMIYAFDRSFETAIAASAAPIVGILAEKLFGWQVLFFFWNHSVKCKQTLPMLIRVCLHLRQMDVAGYSSSCGLRECSERH